MCTVSYIPTAENIFLASNRDENPLRVANHLIESTSPRDQKMLFPQDTKTGGTWIALKNNFDAAVLLNGAYERHVVLPEYRRSRGLVLLEVMEAPQPLHQLNTIDLQKIEPFTIVLFTGGDLFEFRWDGRQKITNRLDPAKAKTWSSVTLYNEEVQSRKTQIFESLVSQNKLQTADEILHFHQGCRIPGYLPNPKPERFHHIETVSITIIDISPKDASLTYFDLQSLAETKHFFYKKQHPSLEKAAI